LHSEFDNIVNRINQGQLWDFPGGVHPPERKDLSNQVEIASIPLPPLLYVQVKQHIGVEGHLLVEVDDEVLKGQALTKSMNPFAVPVHAPASGTVTGIVEHISAHPSGLPELCIVIKPSPVQNWVELSPLPDYQNLPKIKVIEAICDAGISGMGGAGFPTHIKVSPKKNLEFLIINGVECEPYITSDDRLMREHAWQIRQGIDVLNHLLSPKQVIIAIEDNKKQAIEAMRIACQENDKYLVCSIPTKYPAGGEKQLIQVLTNREVPKHGLPIDVGVIMQNVGTCFAIADAIFSGKPLIQRVVTITGEALDKPQNVWAPIGTPVSHLLVQGKYQQDRQSTPRFIMGGPMMGFEIASPQVPVVKTTNCILAPSEQAMPRTNAEQACIRCSACADACPVSLLPQQLFWHSKGKELEKAEEYNLFDCIECGACAYVCPSEIPLVHYYRIAKAEIRKREEEKQKSDRARERFETRQARLVKDQQERDEKHRLAAEARRLTMEQKGDNSKDKIAAALARAKAKKQANDDTANTAPTEVSPSPTQDKVAAAIARAKAKKQAQQDIATEQGDDSAMEQSTETGAEKPLLAPQASPKQDKIAMAVARAKAKRDAMQAAALEKAESPAEAKPVEPGHDPIPSHLKPTDDEVDAKKLRIAAAVAKAKAKKIAAEQEQLTSAPGSAHADPGVETPIAKDELKKQRIAAAVAKAKAKKAAQQAATGKDETENDPQ
jgi:Na+-translocating ferredoxin:NAD+ oxidoreductase subunit C